jgi:FkbM family methyltransferase
MSDVVQCSVRGLAILLRSASAMERFRIATYESKEPETLDWIDEHFAAGDTLYDIGANVGVYSVYAALRSPKGRVFAFEPSVHNCAALIENARLNGLANLASCCFPISAGRTFGWFHLSTIMAGSSMHAFEREDLMLGFGERSVMAQGGVSTSLDELLADGFPPPSLIKIDVDGLETDILRGARDTLHCASLRSVLVELNWRGLAPSREAVELVKAAGFRLVAVGDISERERMKWQNYIFVRTGM